MYHSGHSDLICTLALSHIDQLPQVTVTLGKGDTPTFSGHPEALGPPRGGVDKRKKEIIDRIILPVQIDAHVPPIGSYRLVFSIITLAR